MIKFIFLLFIFNCHLAMAKENSNKMQQSRKVLEALLPFQKSTSTDGFSVEKCKIDKSKWMLLLVTKEPFTEKISFTQNCHIEGEYTAKMAIPFPVNFKLQKIDNFHQVKFNFLIQLLYDPIPLLKIEMQNGHLIGNKDNITFEVDYAAEIDPFSKEFIKKDKGGTITIKSINGKKVKEKFPIKR